MKKKNEMPSILKVLKIVGIALASVGMVAATIISVVGFNKQKDMNTDLSESLAKVNESLNLTSINLNSEVQMKEALEISLADIGLELEEFKEADIAKDAVIEDYKTLVLELETVSAVVEFTGYDEEVSIASFDLGTLNDNQFEKLSDYNVDFDGDEIDVKEYLSIKGDFENEKEVSFNFVEGDIVYKLAFDTGLDFSEDSLEVKLLGEDVEIINISTGEMTIKRVSKEYALVGDIINGVEIVRIGEDSIIVKNGEEQEIIKDGESETINDIKVSVENIFYSDNIIDNLVVVRIGEDLDETIEVGDYFDEEELYKFTSINDGEIVISLDEEVEEVKTLVLPNSFATISFELSNEDYNEVEVVKKNDKFDELRANFEEFEASKVEYNGSDWIIEDDNGDDLIVTSLELKDSDFVIDFVSDVNVSVAGIEVTPSNVAVNGDEDEVFITENGIVVDERDNWNEDDDEKLLISVPEEVIEVTLKVE